MAVKIGSARIDENGKAHGGLAGDQTGKELSTQSWYKHTKGWRVVRPVSPTVADKLATAMKAACENSHIGYDQYQRDTLLKFAANVTPIYFPGAVKTNCETDCSALVRVCIAYAFGRDIIGDILDGTRFSTANMVKFMVKTGHFVEMKGEKYTDSPDFLKKGDVLCTKIQGHTVIVLNDGPKAVDDVIDIYGHLVRTELKKGMKGEDVRFLQECLIEMGYALPRYGADGDFGSETQSAVVKFQQGNVPDMIVGVVNIDCWNAIHNYIGSNMAAPLGYITRSLHITDSGDDVKIMQECFILAGYEFPKYGADGEFGRETRDTVVAFQVNVGIEPTGCFDDETKKALVNVLKSIS